MKRHGNLWPQVIEFENLLTAAHQAQRGKRFRKNVLAFNYHLEAELFQLQAELENRTYRPGIYRTFQILDPKPRLISAAPYRDRVVHHALCNVIIPLLERMFIRDTYANRCGYGTHRALKRFTQFFRSSRYILQCDIRKYFPSIDHELLKAMLHRRIKCPETLWLIDTIIDGSNEQDPVMDYFPGDTLLTPIQRRKGLPIGNLTSQFFANIYLNEFDHFVTEQLKVSKYLRYVDDFALFADDKQFLADARGAIEDYLAHLRLKIHPSLQQMQQSYAAGQLSLDDLAQRLQSWEAHLKHGHTHRLRRSIFDRLVFCRSNPPPSNSATLAAGAGIPKARRLLDQQS